ncbi:MAG: tyrosine-type recombinase/integrase [Candidatus Bathyarchaeia archaeon]
MTVIEKFLEQYPNKSTKKTYRVALNNYFKSLYGLEADLHSVSETYFTEGRDYKSDVQKFFNFIYEKPPKTLRTFLAVINNFLLFNQVELPKLFWKGISRRIKGTRARTMDHVPSNAELRKILTHMDAKGKAFFLMLASSGMRIGEALQLKFQDVNLNSDPVKLEIRGEYTKTGDPRIAFISSEAKEALEEWLKIREAYIKTAVKRSHRYIKSKKDERIFPFADAVAYCLWNNALDKAQLNRRDFRTNRRKIHPHVLRKSFRTKMGQVIPVDIVEALIGHEGYLTEVYRRYTTEDLAKFYKKGEHTLLVFAGGDISKLKHEIKERNKQLNTLLVNLNMENQNLKQRVAELEKQLEELEEFQKETIRRINELAEFRKEMKFYKEGNVTVIYRRKSFLPSDELEEIVDETLERHKKDLQKELEEITESLRKRRKIKE